MPAFKDLTGQIFGRLTVIKQAENKNGRVMWLCICSCKNKEYIALSKTLLNGTCKSCGCITKERCTNNISKNKKYNIYDLTGEYGIGYYKDNTEFYFDLNNYDKIKDCYWTKKDEYAVTVTLKTKLGKRISMHQLLYGDYVDHIDGNRSNNRKYNIRKATTSENNSNTKIYKNNKSGVKGVSYHDAYGYKATIQKNKIVYDLIYTYNFEEAVLYREIAELYLFKEFSRRYNELKNKYKDIDLENFIKNNIPKILNC